MTIKLFTLVLALFTLGLVTVDLWAPTPAVAQRADDINFIATGGGAIDKIEVEDGGEVEFQSGATLELQNGATTAFADVTLTAQDTVTVSEVFTLTLTGSYMPIAAAGAAGGLIDGAGCTPGTLTVIHNIVNQTITITDTGDGKLSSNAALGQYDTLTVLCVSATEVVEVAQADN